MEHKKFKMQHFTISLRLFILPVGIKYLLLRIGTLVLCSLAGLDGQQVLK